MAKLIIKQSPPLGGRVRIDGAKNSVLPIMAASLLAEDICVLEEIPLLEDVYIACKVLGCFGSQAIIWNNTITIDSRNVRKGEAPYDLMKK